MQRTFVYLPSFDRLLARRQIESEIEAEILKNPNAGSGVQGAGGIRKFRLKDVERSKGKRGGLRIFFLDLPTVSHTYLLWILEKGESENLDREERKILKDLADQIRKEWKHENKVG